MPNPQTPLLLRRLAAETALLLAVGLFLGVLGPFGTAEQGAGLRLTYWPTVIVGGGVIGIAIDAAVQRWLRGFWLRLTLDSVLMTLPVTGLVWVVSLAMFHEPAQQPHWAMLIFQVFVISFAVMTLRLLAWRGVWTERHAAAGAPSGDAASVFRQRL